MKPYSNINSKAVANTIVIILALCLGTFLLRRPLGYIVHWVTNVIDYNYFGYMFCNPTLWFLGLDEVMWECPRHSKGSASELGMILLFLISLIVHIIAFILSVVGLCELWGRINKKRW